MRLYTEELSIAIGHFMTKFQFFRKDIKFTQKNCCLECVKPTIYPDADIIVFVLSLSMDTERNDFFGNLVIVCEAHTAITVTP